MKPLIPILVVATTSLAVASIQFAQQAATQRERAQAELQLRQKQDARVAELERNQARLERELALARRGAGLVPADAADARRPAGPRSPASDRVASADAGDAAGAPPFPPFAGRRGALDSPAARNVMRSRMKNQVRRLYGDAGAALGLSQDKSNQLLDLLADQQARNMGFDRANVPEGQTPQQYFQAQQQKSQDEIQTLVGADKMADWATYQKSLPQRAELGQAMDQLDQAGYPMSDSQRTEMLAAITDESQRLPRPTLAQGVSPEETAAQMTQWQSDYSKALLDRAKSVLSTDQYNAYKDYQDLQTQMGGRFPPPMLNAGPGGAVFRNVGR
jgi:hypothetical protein